MPPARGGGAAAGLNDDNVINPDLLAMKFEGIVCIVCTGVMVEPTVGCPGLHSLCRACYVKALKKKKECPMCRHPVDETTLVRNRDLAGLIAQQPLRCKHSEGDAAGPSAAKRAKLAPADSMTVKSLRTELGQRGLDSTGNKPVLVARLEEDRKKDAGCMWKGCVGGLAAHLGECEWAPVKCLNAGCTESPPRKDLLEHNATCEHRKVPCGHCKRQQVQRSLAEHEGGCVFAVVECPNEGCIVLNSRLSMDSHRAECQHEKVTCLCPGCDARPFRKDLDAHVLGRHMKKPGENLQRLWRENAELRALSTSELRQAAAAPTSWVFNWRADGWKPGRFLSEKHNFGRQVKGECSLLVDFSTTQFISFQMQGIDKCKMHATFSILDKHDKTLRQVHEIGTANTPIEFESNVRGGIFTATAAEKAQSVRADGSIRLRAVVRLFLDPAA